RALRRWESPFPFWRALPWSAPLLGRPSLDSPSPERSGEERAFSHSVGRRPVLACFPGGRFSRQVPHDALSLSFRTSPRAARPITCAGGPRHHTSHFPPGRRQGFCLIRDPGTTTSRIPDFRGGFAENLKCAFVGVPSRSDSQQVGVGV
ncbi:unnamed protein product, partial [Ixodes pacificus]